MRNKINAILMVAIFTVVMTGCEGGNAIDKAGQMLAELEDTIPTQPTTPTDTTHTPTTDPNTWSFAYDPYASMTPTGYVTAWWHLVNEAGKTDSICHAYQVKAELGDTLWLNYKGVESSFSDDQISLVTRHRDESEMVEGKDHVYRAHETSVHTLHCGAYERTLEIDREYAKIVVKGFDKFFDFAEYRLENGEIKKRHDSFTRNDSVFDREYDDLYIDFMHGMHAYRRHCVTVIDRFIKVETTEPETPEEPETPTTPEEPKGNKMPAVDILLSGAPTMKGQFMLSPAYDQVTQHVSAWTTTFTVANADKFVVYAATVTTDGNTKTNFLVECPNPPYTLVNTATKQNGKWVGTNVERGSGKNFIYRWGNGATEYWSISENQFCIGGAKNLAEDGKSRQTPFINTAYTKVVEYDDGYVYSAVGTNNTGTEIYTITIGWKK